MEIFDYLKWRGDLLFDERDFNELDALILSMIVYEDFDDILSKRKSLTLKELSNIYFTLYNEDYLKTRKTLTNHNYLVFKEAAKTKRFESLIISQYINDIDVEKDLQFSAMTCQYKNKFKYIVFRGTDDTLVGWKEDFKMTYVDEVLSQKKAVDYIINIDQQDSVFLKTFLKMDYYVGGHSKGGNLAMYASGHAPSKLQKRIKKIYCFDSPGFSEDIWLKPSMMNIADKAESFMPTSSFIGRMFEHKEKITIVQSKQLALLQHDLYNWHIDIDHLLYADCFSEASNEAIKDLNALLLDLDLNERKIMIESVFDIFKKQNLYNFEDLTKINLTNIIQALKEFSDIDPESRKAILELLRIIIEINTKIR